MNRAVFLDRDGVINEAEVREGKPFPPASLKTLKILPNVKEALEQLKKNGWILIVITNQPDVARGTIKKDTVEEIHTFLNASFPIDEILSCYHDSNEQCSCRKPKPGFLIDSKEKYNLNLRDCFMVGDRWRDIEAGLAVGCKTIFIDYGYFEKQPDTYSYKVSSLWEASQIILGERNEKS